MHSEPRWLTSQEIEAGLVLHVSPDALLREGAQPSSGANGPCFGDHWFLCVENSDSHGLWLPLFSRDLGRRKSISTTGRTGLPRWTAGVWHYETRQTWRMSHRAAVRGAEAGRDDTTPGRRNRLRPDRLPLPWRPGAPVHRIAS